MLAAVGLAQSPDSNSINGPNKANGGAVAKFRKYKVYSILKNDFVY